MLKVQLQLNLERKKEREEFEVKKQRELERLIGDIKPCRCCEKYKELYRQRFSYEPVEGWVQVESLHASYSIEANKAIGDKGLPSERIQDVGLFDSKFKISNKLKVSEVYINPHDLDYFSWSSSNRGVYVAWGHRIPEDYRPWITILLINPARDFKWVDEIVNGGG